MKIGEEPKYLVIIDQPDEEVANEHTEYETPASKGKIVVEFYELKRAVAYMMRRKLGMEARLVKVINWEIEESGGGLRGQYYLQPPETKPVHFLPLPDKQDDLPV